MPYHSCLAGKRDDQNAANVEEHRCDLPRSSSIVRAVYVGDNCTFGLLVRGRQAGLFLVAASLDTTASIFGPAGKTFTPLGLH